MAVATYVFSGFLESGKTSFIASVLQDPGFTHNEHTLVIQCEEGEIEYEPEMLKSTNTVIEYIEDEDEFDAETLTMFARRHHPDRIIIEVNGMWDLDRALNQLPPIYDLVQVITTVNTQTFELYAVNMGVQMLQHISYADMVVFNRATEETRQMIRDRNVRSMNPQAQIYFENEDGTSEDYGAGLPPPYDLDADVVEIQDPDFGFFYLDASENPEDYDGKIVHFKGQTHISSKVGENEYVPGRMAMVCCANDVRFVGFIADVSGKEKPEDGSWQWITAEVRVEERPQYRGPGPVLYVKELHPAEPPAEEVVTFNR